MVKKVNKGKENKVGMDKDFLKGFKFGLGFILVISTLAIVGASGWHIANEILSGEFSGDYNFTGSINFTDAISIGDITIDTNALYINNTIPKTYVGTGTITKSSSGPYILGTGTSFTTELEVGYNIFTSTCNTTVTEIINDTKIRAYCPILSNKAFNYSKSSVIINQRNSSFYIREFAYQNRAYSELGVELIHNSRNSSNPVYFYKVSADEYKLGGYDFINSDYSFFDQTGNKVLDIGITNEDLGIRNTSLRFFAGNVSRLFINGSTGNIGIGTGSPDFLLDVEKNTGTGYTNAKFGYNDAVYLVNSAPSIGFNAYWDPIPTTWRYGALSSSEYGGGMTFSTTSGDLTFFASPSTGNQDGAMTGSATCYIDRVGNLNCIGSKSFNIEDPRYNNESIRLVHAAIEGPESGVYYRGEGKLTDGIATIVLPDYFEYLVREENRTVILTSKNGWSPLYVQGDVKNSEFIVKTTSIGNISQEFYWEVKGIRLDVAALDVEKIDKSFSNIILN